MATQGGRSKGPFREAVAKLNRVNALLAQCNGDAEASARACEETRRLTREAIDFCVSTERDAIRRGKEEVKDKDVSNRLLGTAWRWPGPE